MIAMLTLFLAAHLGAQPRQLRRTSQCCLRVQIQAVQSVSQLLFAEFLVFARLMGVVHVGAWLLSHRHLTKQALLAVALRIARIC